MTSAFLVSLFSTLLMFSHIFGFILIAKGVLILLKGIKGEGQSEQGIDHLKNALLKLLKPALFGLVSLSLLVGLTYWERSALTSWIQAIAPLSTLLWVVWAQKTAKKVQSGDMFEALIPIGALETDYIQDQSLVQKAEDWAKLKHPLTAKALVRTSLEAIQELSKTEKQKLDIDDLALILRESFAEIHQVLQRFPLAQSLTLSDWAYEVERLSEIWGQGLTQVEIGRHLVNPFTIIDRKMFWQWSNTKPGDLLNDELSAWLHQGVYLIVLRRWSDLSQASHSQASHSQASQTTEEEQTSNQLGNADEQLAKLAKQQTPDLWTLMARKFTVPFWLYWLLSSVAVSLNHGLFGIVFSGAMGAILYLSLSKVTSIQNWRSELANLGSVKRNKIADLEMKKQNSLANLATLEDEFEAEFSKQPSQALLKLMSQGFIQIAQEHRRPEHPDAPLSLSNATLSDVTLSVQLLCDDFIDWRNEGSILSMVVSFASKLGLNLSNVDEKLLKGIQDWAYSEEQPVSDQSTSDQSTSDQATQESESFSLQAQSQRIDAWVTPYIDDAGFLLKMGLSAIQLSLKTRISKELKERIIPLYQGTVENVE